MDIIRPAPKVCVKLKANPNTFESITLFVKKFNISSTIAKFLDKDFISLAYFRPPVNAIALSLKLLEKTPAIISIIPIVPSITELSISSLKNENAAGVRKIATTTNLTRVIIRSLLFTTLLSFLSFLKPNITL